MLIHFQYKKNKHGISYFIPCLFLGFLFLSLYSCKEKKENTTILFAGDLLLDRGVRQKIENLGIEKLFHPSIDSILKKHEIVIANLECPATKINAPINKQFIFRAEPEWLDELKKHHITHLNLANNHSMDQGRDGLIDTEKNINNYGLISLGFGNNAKEACQAQLLTSSPRKIYLFSSVQIASENWVYLEQEPGVCEEPVSDIVSKIKSLRQKEPHSVILVQFHWGPEHQLKPVTSQKQQAHQVINAGADAIIGHHSHTIQTIEHYKGKPIYYSIGNFIFDATRPINKKGILVGMKIHKEKIEFNTFPFKIQNCTPILQPE